MLAPLLTIIGTGLIIEPFSPRNFSADSLSKLGDTGLGVYFVKPASRDAIAAALICSGVSKSGSPGPKLQTSIPSAFIAFALLSIERVQRGYQTGGSWESYIKIFPTSICYQRPFQPMNSPFGCRRMGIANKSILLPAIGYLLLRFLRQQGHPFPSCSREENRRAIVF